MMHLLITILTNKNSVYNSFIKTAQATVKPHLYCTIEFSQWIFELAYYLFSISPYADYSEHNCKPHTAVFVNKFSIDVQTLELYYILWIFSWYHITSVWSCRITLHYPHMDIYMDISWFHIYNLILTSHKASLYIIILLWVYTKNIWLNNYSNKINNPTIIQTKLIKQKSYTL